MRMGYLKFNTTDGINATFHEFNDEHELKIDENEIILVADLNNPLLNGLVNLLGVQTEVQEIPKAVRKNRKPTGRPVVDAKKVEMAMDLYKHNIPINDIANYTKLSKATIYKKIKENQLKECI